MDNSERAAWFLIAVQPFWLLVGGVLLALMPPAPNESWFHPIIVIPAWLLLELVAFTVSGYGIAALLTLRRTRRKIARRSGEAH